MEKIKNWIKEHKIELAVSLGGAVFFASGMLLGYKMGEIDASLEFNAKLAQDAHDELIRFFDTLEDCEITHF